MGRHLWRDDGVDLAADQHLLIGLVTGGIFDPQAGWRRERDILGPGQHPGDLAVRHPEELLENPLHPYATGGLVTLHADAAADEVTRRPYAFGGIHEHEAVAETPVRKHGQGDERMAALLRHEIAESVEFTGVAFAVARQPPMAIP